jgi:hypothetical protein
MFKQVAIKDGPWVFTVMVPRRSGRWPIRHDHQSFHPDQIWPSDELKVPKRH